MFHTSLAVRENSKGFFVPNKNMLNPCKPLVIS